MALDVSRQSEESSYEYQLQTAVKNAGNKAKPSILQYALAQGLSRHKTKQNEERREHGEREKARKKEHQEIIKEAEEK